MPATSSQKTLVGLILVLAATTVAYRLVYAAEAQRTAALYIGVPTVLAVGLALLPRSGSATGMLLRGATLAVLIAGIVLPEGLLCLAFAFPLVAVVALAVGTSIDLARRRHRRQGPTLMAVTVPLLLLSLEGLVGSPFDPHDAATATVTVAATPDEVAAALADPPTFDEPLPTFLRIGWNRPVGARGRGIEVGDRRTVTFTGGTHDDHPLRLFGLTGEPSAGHHAEMHLTVVESAPGRVVFAVDHDGTMVARWADLDRAVVTWEPAGDGTTRVRWRLEYERLIQPSLYFGPLQRYAMDQAAGYLLDTAVAGNLP
jgi:hypothetical protein